ncbi:MAG TPA: DUF4836 family protein [Bacteroidia bacterium]|jgi:hypothetical protein|nr:DUF4836 family protein [Bacteroidia bacterium]
MQKQLRLFLFIGLFNSVCCFSQELRTHIPADARLVITLNAQSYSAKADMSRLNSMDFFRAMQKGDTASGNTDQLVAQILSKPTETGIEMLPSVYVFRVERDTVIGWCYLFGLKDEAKFADFLTQSLQEKNKTKLNPKQTTGFNMLSSGRLNIAWTKGFAYLLITDKPNPYAYPNYISATPDQAVQDSLAMVVALAAEAQADSIARADSIQAAQLALKEKANRRKPGKETLQERKQREERAMRLQAVTDSIADEVAARKEQEESEQRSIAMERAEQERIAQLELRTAEKGDELLHLLMNMKPENSLSAMRNFSDTQKEKFDLAVWMNYSDPSIISRNLFGIRPSYNRADSNPLNKIPSIAKNNYAVAYCIFENGKINLTHTVYLNPEMDALANGIYKKKGCKKFNKYIRGENLMGYTSCSMDVEKTLKAMRSVLMQIYEASLGSEAKYITGMMDITAVFTNDDVVNNLFKGDFVLAVTDLRPFKVNYSKYSYDANFNRSESIEEKDEVLPEFTAMATVGKPEELTKILMAIVKMGGLKQEGKDRYLIDYPGSGRIKLHLALENSILFLSNNEDLIQNKLKTGYPSSEQMNTAQKTLLRSWPLAAYWNGTKTMDLLSKQSDFMAGRKMMKHLNLFKDNIQDVSLNGPIRQGNAYTTHMSLNLKDTSLNSLTQLFSIVNSLYMIGK